MTNARWQKRPDGSNWGDFGPNDQLGRMNLLTPERVQRACREIVEGQTFCLSLPLDYPGGKVMSQTRSEPQLHVVNPDGNPRFNYPEHPSGNATDIECDDFATLTMQYSTHWDSLAHMGQFFDCDNDGIAEPVYYNGFRAGTDVMPHDGVPGLGKGALRLGIQSMAETCVQGRGVMIDLAHHLPTDEGPHSVTFDMFLAILKADAVTVEEGDIVCLHTGLSDLLLDMGKEPDRDVLKGRAIALDGRDEALLNWITDSGLVALVSDNFAVESFPARPAEALPAADLPLHEHCLFKLGIPLGELWNLGDLSRWLRNAGRHRFFLTAPPLRLPGAVGSPVTPVATV